MDYTLRDTDIYRGKLKAGSVFIAVVGVWVGNTLSRKRGITSLFSSRARGQRPALGARASKKEEDSLKYSPPKEELPVLVAPRDRNPT